MSFPTGVSDGAASGTGRTGSPDDRPLRVRVLYGSETGNAEGVAHDLVAAVQGRGIDVSVTMLDDASPDELPGGGCILVVTATNGDGDMPYNAFRFWRALAAESAPRLDGVPFSVLGLGDTGYFDFCQAAVDLDRRFEELGLSASDYTTRDAVIALLLEHPELMQRPVIFRGERAVIARPSEKVLELLD